MTTRPLLRLEDKLAAEDLHLRALGRGHQPSRFAAAIGLALAAHGAMALIPAPATTRAQAPEPRMSAYPPVARWVPPGPDAPPIATAPVVVVPPIVAALPLVTPPPIVDTPGISDSDLEAFMRIEPVAEPLPRVAVNLPKGVETLIGSPSPPPPKPVPAAPTAATATRPTLALGGRVDPEYPLAARALRLTGTVALDVEVRDDGTVGYVHVVRVSRRGVGFEAAAIDAVRQWRFVPGTQGGRPVTTTTSVEVTFQ